MRTRRLMMTTALFTIGMIASSAAQTTGTGFTITVGEAPAPLPVPEIVTETPIATAEIRNEDPQPASATPPVLVAEPLRGKAEIPIPEIERTPVAAPEPLTSVAGVQERVSNPVEVATQEPAWRPEVAPGEFFGTGIVDVTLGGLGSERFDKARVAGYVEGMTKSGINVTASADTRELPIRDLFSDLGSRDPDRVLNRMRTEQNYTVYGDDSTSREMAPTSGKAYVSLERGGASLLWGDFRVTNDTNRYARSDRTLYGLRLGYEDARTNAALWAASPDRVSRRDVLRATGGAVYSLSRADAFPGTEKVMIRVVDAFTGRIISTELLSPGVDYRFNALQGILILNRPVTDVIGERDVNREVVVAYEHTPGAGDPDARVIGGRVSYALTEELSVGVSGNQEKSGSDTHKIYGADANYVSEGIRVSAEVAKSRGPRIGVTTTDLGGFGDQPTLGYGNADSSGTAYRVASEIDLGQFTSAEGTFWIAHESTRAGFASADEFVEQDERETVVGTTVRVGPGNLTAEASDFSSDDGRDERIYKLAYDLSVNGLERGVYAESVERTDPDDLRNTGKRTVVGVRGDVMKTDASRLWAFGQATTSVSGGMKRDDRVGLGYARQLSNGWAVSGEVSDGTLGEAGYVELARTQGEQEIAIGYRQEAKDPALDEDREGEGYAYARISQKVSDAFRIRAESRDYVAGNELGHANAIGVSWADMGWSVDTDVTLGTLRSREGEDIDRRSLSLGASYAGDGRHSGAIRAEYRRDRSEDAGRDGRVIAVTGTYRYALSEDWRATSSVEYVDAKGGGSFDAGRFLKADIGAAWRGAESDRWSALFLISRVEDVPGTGVTRDDGTGDRKKATVVSADVNHKPAPRWTIGAKVGYRWMDVAPAGTSDYVESDSALAIARVDYEIDKKWDISADLRVQTFEPSGATRTGATFGVWREVGDNARVGVGYHHGGVSSDLRDLDDPEKGLFLNLTAKF